VGKGELETGLQELTDVRPLDVVLLLNLGDPQDVDRPKPSPVPSGQVLVQSLDGTDSGELPELLVHVVGSRSRVVSEPDTKVLDLEGSLLVDDVDSDNLTVGLLDLLQLPQKVPEPRLGDDLVGSKDPHPVELGGGLGLGREGSAEDRVFGESGHFSVCG